MVRYSSVPWSRFPLPSFGPAHFCWSCGDYRFRSLFATFVRRTLPAPRCAPGAWRRLGGSPPCPGFRSRRDPAVSAAGSRKKRVPLRVPHLPSAPLGVSLAKSGKSPSRGVSGNETPNTGGYGPRRCPLGPQEALLRQENDSRWDVSRKSRPHN